MRFLIVYKYQLDIIKSLEEKKVRNLEILRRAHLILLGGTKWSKHHLHRKTQSFPVRATRRCLIRAYSVTVC